MKEVLVLGDGASPPTRISSTDILHLVTEGTNVNVRLQINVFRTKFFRELRKRFDDLLRIATFIYTADTRISRGSERDVFSDQWSRHFHFVLPVWDLEFWQQSMIQEQLTDTLQFLTGDSYVFEFVQRSYGIPFQGILQFKELPDPLPQVDVVILFSGGADSLAAVLEARNEGRQPILVSHRSAPVLDRRQKTVVEELRKRFSDWVFPHISMWVNRRGGKRAVEFTQRSRAFLFTSLGVVGAALLDIDEVRLCDNGIVSINLPQSGQNIGTLLSRSTHPRFLALAQDFMRVVTERKHLTLANTLLFKTKKEVLDTIAASGYPELLQETVSCAHIEKMTKLQPHCGVCSQCIDRRFASEATGLVDCDLVRRYEKDIFVHPLLEGTERTHVENYVRFARKLEQMENPGDIFTNFPELIECLPMQGDVDSFGQDLWNLFQRHQQNVNGVLEKKIQEHSREIRQGILPTTCLIRLVSSRGADIVEDEIIGSEIRQEVEFFKEKLRKVPQGTAHASTYQCLVLEILDFLFDPELIEGKMEVKTYEGTERRDLIFTNNSNQPFWTYVRNEHSAFLLMFETKNTRKLSSAHLNQTNTYLGDRLGRLGFIVTRNPAASAQQRKAYSIYNDSPARKIILMLSDNDLRDMLDMKCRGHEPTEFIRNLYRNFRESVQ